MAVCQSNRQADYIGVGPVDTLDELRREALDSVRAGFVHRFAGSYVAGDLRFTHGTEPDGSYSDVRLHAIAKAHGNAGHDFMALPGEYAKHPSGVGGVLRLTHYSVVKDHCRIGCQHYFIRARNDSARFLFGEPQNVIARRFTGMRRFIDIGGPDGELESGRFQQLGAAR